MPAGPAPEPESDERTQAGRLVHAARTRAGVSQRELARRSGVPGPVVNAIERSRRQPSVPTLAKLLRGLNLELRLNAVSTDVSVRTVSEAERLRAHEVYSALTLANHIARAKRQERARGVR